MLQILPIKVYVKTEYYLLPYKVKAYLYHMEYAMKHAYRCGTVAEDEDYDMLITFQYLYYSRPNDYTVASCGTELAIYFVILHM